MAITIDDGAGRRAGKPACSGLEGGCNLLADHQAGFALGAVLLFGKRLEPKTNDLAGFDREHGTGKPREAVISCGADGGAVKGGNLVFSDDGGVLTV